MGNKSKYFNRGSALSAYLTVQGEGSQRFLCDRKQPLVMKRIFNAMTFQELTVKPLDDDIVHGKVTISASHSNTTIFC